MSKTETGHLQREFDKLCVACLSDISKEQYIDLRRFFFAGASAMLRVEMTLLSPGNETTEADLDMIRTLSRELLEFNAAVRRGEK
jgi:hypothetical protein